jgi:hypothetical protein
LFAAMDDASPFYPPPHQPSTFAFPPARAVHQSSNATSAMERQLEDALRREYGEPIESSPSSETRMLRDQLENYANAAARDSGELLDPLLDTPRRPTNTSLYPDPSPASRLRKACDACSLRKIKVCCLLPPFSYALLTFTSATTPVRPARPAEPSTFHAHTIDRVGDEALRTNMQRLSNASVRTMTTRTQRSRTTLVQVPWASPPRR